MGRVSPVPSTFAACALLCRWPIPSPLVHHLIRVLEQSGEGSAAQLVRKLGGWAEIAREFCYRLYTVCERKKRAADALAYNGLVQSWPEISRLARMEARPEQAELFAGGGTEGTR